MGVIPGKPTRFGNGELTHLARIKLFYFWIRRPEGGGGFVARRASFSSFASCTFGPRDRSGITQGVFEARRSDEHTGSFEHPEMIARMTPRQTGPLLPALVYQGWSGDRCATAAGVSVRFVEASSRFGAEWLEYQRQARLASTRAVAARFPMRKQACW